MLSKHCYSTHCTQSDLQQALSTVASHTHTSTRACQTQKADFMPVITTVQGKLIILYHKTFTNYYITNTQ